MSLCIPSITRARTRAHMRSGESGRFVQLGADPAPVGSIEMGKREDWWCVHAHARTLGSRAEPNLATVGRRRSCAGSCCRTLHGWTRM